MSVTTSEVTTSSPEETLAFGRSLAETIRSPALVLLYGELGAGKTTLVKGIVSGLGAGSEDDVTSPTYVLVQEYGTRPRIYHVDLYRVDENRPADLESLGLEDLLAEDAVVLVEWPERLKLPGLQPSLRVYLEIAGEEERHIRVAPAPGE